MARLRFVALGAVPLLLLACGGAEHASVFDEPPSTVDSVDSGSTVEDTSTPVDSGITGAPGDSGPSPFDTGVDTGAPRDSGPTPFDTGSADTAQPPVDVGPDVPVTVPCTEPEAKTFGGHCYFPINTRSWSVARDFCASRSAHLVTITSAEEQALVATIRNGEERWIGLARGNVPVTPGAYRWVTMETSSYANWFTAEPNGTGNCVRLLGDGRWADQACTEAELGICERE